MVFENPGIFIVNSTIGYRTKIFPKLRPYFSYGGTEKLGMLFADYFPERIVVDRYPVIAPHDQRGQLHLHAHGYRIFQRQWPGPDISQGCLVPVEPIEKIHHSTVVLKQK